MKNVQKTLKDAVQLTCELYWRGTKNEYNALLCMGHVYNVFGDQCNVNAIERAGVVNMQTGWKRAGLKAGTINRRTAALNKVLKTANAAGWRREGAIKGLVLKEPAGRTTVLTATQVNLMALAMPFVKGALATWLYDTGMRVSEALRLEWGDVHPDQTFATVRESKNGSPRSVPLSAGARATLKAIAESGRTLHARALVFEGVDQRAFNAAWRGAAASIGKGNGSPEFVPHALRHTRATLLVRAGVPLAVVQKIMGHKSIQTTLRYTHLEDADVLSALKDKGML
jgi:integrase